jgi:hypothetical protein
VPSFQDLICSRRTQDPFLLDMLDMLDLLRTFQADIADIGGLQHCCGHGGARPRTHKDVIFIYLSHVKRFGDLIFHDFSC